MHKKLIISVILIISGICTLGYFIQKNSLNRVASSHLIQHTMEINYQASKITTTAKEIKTLLTAISITKDTTFFTALSAAKNLLGLHVNQLIQLTEDNISAHQSAIILGETTKRYLKSLTDTDLVDTKDTSSAKLLAQIYSDTYRIQQQEETLLAQSRLLYAKNVQIFMRLSLLLLLLIIGFIFILIIAIRKIFTQSDEQYLREGQLNIAHKTLYLENNLKEKRASELLVAMKELFYQKGEKRKRAAELVIANEELSFQNKEKEKRADELATANLELIYQNNEKEKRAAELVLANIELSFQSLEKEKRANELIVANAELLYQNDEKGKRAAELIIANIELSFQNEEKNKRANELKQANIELSFSNDEKEKRAEELGIANQELSFQNLEKEKRALELKEAMQLLNTSEIFNRGVLNSLSSHIAVMDHSGKLIAVNESWNQFALMNGETTLQRTGIGSNYFTICDQAIKNGDLIAKVALQGIKEVMRSKREFFYMEYPCHSATIQRWFGMRAIRFESDDQLVVVSHMNISERKIAENNLLISESSLKEAQAIAHIGNFEVNLTTNHSVWSDEFFKILGLKKDEVETTLQQFLSYIHVDDIAVTKNKIKKYLGTLALVKLEFRFYKKDGSLRYGYCESQFGLNENGEPIRLFGIFQDVTDSKMAELERNKMVNDLMQRNTDLEQFAYIISHNLRAPVANIIGATAILDDPTINLNDQLTLKNGINQSILKLDSVIKDLNHILEVKTETGKNKELVHFSELVQVIKTSIKNLIDETDIHIHCNFTLVNELLTLKPYLYSIFYNLILNSIKYKKQHTALVIDIKSTKVMNDICLIFSDNGMGINLLKKENQIFSLYQRFHDHVEGKGMGLYMVKMQVEALHGTIGVKSIENKGTTFNIVLPNH